MKATKCQHTHTLSGRVQGYSGSVSVYPYTDENRAAHGCVTYVETCLDCRQTRAVNANGGHREYSPWSAGVPHLVAA